MSYNEKIAARFRGFLPVIIDIETSGVNPKKDALLEIGAVTVGFDENDKLVPKEEFHTHIEAFKGANFDEQSMKINRIQPFHPFRFAKPEPDVVELLNNFVRPIIKESSCNRGVLVGHNAWFDLAFLNAMQERVQLKKNLFHKFTCLDTASLGELVYGHTVLAELLKRAKIEFDPKEHHSALYDARKTAELFCKMINQQPWPYS